MSYLGGYFDFDWKVLVQCLPLPLECGGLHLLPKLLGVLFRAPLPRPAPIVFANVVQNKAVKNRPFPLRESDFHRGDSLNFILSLSCYSSVCYCIHASHF